MEQTLGSGQHRGSKYFAHRNVHIGHTVFKVRLLCLICQGVQENLHLRLIACPCIAGYGHILCLIQHIYQVLLDLFVLLIIQRIDADSLMENLCKILANRRYRECR